MALVLTCPGCGKRYELDEKLAGRRVRCKQCAHVTRVPAEEPAPLPKAVRPAPRNDFEEGPRPARAASRPVKKQRKLEGRLPPLVKVGLSLVGALMVGPAVIAAGMAVASGRPELAVIPLAILGAVVCLGFAVVTHLKLCFMAAETSTLAELACIFVPGYLLIFIVQNWEATRRLAFVYLAGLAGFFLWCVFVPPYLRPAGAPQSSAGTPQSSGQDVTLIVSNVSTSAARQVIADKIRELADPGPGVDLSFDFSSRQELKYNLWPVRDPRALAARITFGRVTKIAGREIHVVAAPVSAEEIASHTSHQAERETTTKDTEAVVATAEPPSNPAPPADADPVTRSVYGLKSASGNRRKQAVRQLAQMTPADDRRSEVSEALWPLLDDEDDFLVSDVIRLMARWATPETVPALIPKTTDSRSGVRGVAIETLGKLKDPRAAEAIASRLEEDRFQSEAALRALGPAAEPAVLALLRSPDAGIRGKACNVLADIGGTDTLTFMRKARPDPDTGVRMAAQEAMKAIVARVGLPQKP